MREIRQVFGNGIFNEDGSLNRLKTAEIIFKDEEKRKALNGIIHPYIWRRTQEEVIAAQNHGYFVVVLDMPLLLEIDWQLRVEAVWVVQVPLEVQIERVMARNGFTREQVLERIHKQMPTENKLNYADVVIDNSRSPEDTKRQVKEALMQIPALCSPEDAMIKKLKYKVRRIEFEPPRENTGVKVFVFLMAALSLIFSYIFCATVSWRPSPMIQHIINESAVREGISPCLIEAVMLTESKFDEKAVSKVGAVGMMQLMPETAAWISEQSGLTAEKLEEPDQNIPLGAWYLNFLLKTYHNNEILALAAYNAGRGNVDEWIKE